ncbi:ROK family protein [Streptomyces tateyamensis]|uniref:ROK family protein n=1 Tax=Streptomyces tateyamensis TaxID=565073 RepID=A0A2V4MZB7_9ACTN|nr:ROK family protein [Streptomyces tateyamensis]PYC70620.1 ROK family protein [Streptomyces tateyamensis]
MSTAFPPPERTAHPGPVVQPVPAQSATGRNTTARHTTVRNATVQPLPAHTVLGIDFGGTKTELALADPAGTVLARTRLATLAERGPEQTLARTASAARELAAEARQRFGAPVAAYAAVAPGIIQPDRILLTPNLPGWEELALAERLAAELGVARVPVANDVRAGALAELRRGALRGADPGLYVNLGTGVAAALTVGDRVLAGANQAAGEIGYLNPGSAPVDAVARGQAPLEDLVSGKALADRAERLLGRPLDATGLFRSTEPAARQLVRETLDVLAMTLANLATLVDPERIVLGAGLMSAADLILPELERLLAGATPFPPQLRVAHFRQDAALHGAITLALDSLPEPGPRPALADHLGAR